MNTLAHLWWVPTVGAIAYLIIRPLLDMNWVIREQHRIYKQYRLWR